MAKKSSKKSKSHGRVTPKGTAENKQQQSTTSAPFQKQGFERELPAKGHGFSAPQAPGRTGHRGQR
jgi:hypothetical protein